MEEVRGDPWISEHHTGGLSLSSKVNGHEKDILYPEYQD
jgi:hypothetical protein